ncbi:hypothetical protein ACQWFR_24665, partial [Salmonella enterica subsp. enterica serovar Infantis]
GEFPLSNPTPPVYVTPKTLPAESKTIYTKKEKKTPPPQKKTPPPNPKNSLIKITTKIFK